MKLIIFTDNKKTPVLFAAMQKKADAEISFHPIADIKKAAELVDSATYVYLDFSGVPQAAQKKMIARIGGIKNAGFGIIDSSGSVPDIGELIHSGATDYISKELIKNGLTLKRLSQAAEFAAKRTQAAGPVQADGKKPAPAKKTADTELILSGENWSGIKSGSEYSFCFMFIELDDQQYFKKSFGESQLAGITEAFRKSIESSVSAINGKIWMWTDFGGLILFPFNGKKCDAVLRAFELMLDRKIISVEHYDFKKILSYRIALHIGNTVYRPRGDTGTIISDSINSIFHLGQKHAKKGSFVLTENAEEFIPRGLRKFFLSDGEFEGRKILRMLQSL